MQVTYIKWWSHPISVQLKMFRGSQTIPSEPKDVTELKAGIERFWHLLTPEVCKQYINH